MNFDVLTEDLTTVWIFILLGNVIPAVSVVIAVVLFRRWVRRLGIERLYRSAGHPDNLQGDLRHRSVAARTQHEGSSRKRPGSVTA
jgi:hypothetical protein